MWSIIDTGRKDFIRDDEGKPFMFDTQRKAENWLLKNGYLHGWTNSGTRYFCWEDDSKE